MTESRSYGQRCGVALALDLLGERWTLLIVRELLRGPRRFRDLQSGLDGIGTNLLSARLKRLESGGVIERVDVLPGVRGYAMTELGLGLGRLVDGLALWGSGLVQASLGDAGLETRAAWMASSMRANMVANDKLPPAGVYDFAVGDERFWLHVGAGDAELRDGPAPIAPDLRITTDVSSFARLAFGGTAEVDTEGRRERLVPLFSAFRMP